MQGGNIAILTTEWLCTRIIRLLHAPIRVYDAAGNQAAIYADHGEQQGVLSCDEEYLAMLLEKGRREAPHPAPGGGDPVAEVRRLVRRHRMDPRKPCRVSGVYLYDFAELLLTLHEQPNGGEMESDELFPAAGAGQTC